MDAIAPSFVTPATLFSTVDLPQLFPARSIAWQSDCPVVARAFILDRIKQLLSAIPHLLRSVLAPLVEVKQLLVD